MGKWRGRLTSAQIILLGFGAVIALGSLLLMLPVATRDGRGASFPDAVFTATSAVCVTGLVVQDTATYWSVFGQCVLLGLIQIGGMGVVMAAACFSLLAGKRIGLRERSLMQETLSAPQMGGIVPLTGFILRGSLLVELLGAVVLFPTFYRQFGLWGGAWRAVFHGVSAFCNGGFDLMGTQGAYSSLTSLALDPAVNLAVMALITLGGLGFLTWEDIWKNGLHVRRYRMQSKVILLTSLLLVAAPTAWFFCLEYQDRPFSERLWLSLFQAVTARTAGFNTAELPQMSEGGLVLMLLLMLVGGSPGSTAGGIKTTTLAVLAATTLAVLRQREHTHLFGRRVAEETVRQAVAIVTLYLSVFLLGGLFISRVEGVELLPCLFETGSAVATVGLTLGLTPRLGLLSRGVLILMMLFGRVGGLTLALAAFGSRRGNTARLPQERLIVG